MTKYRMSGGGTSEIIEATSIAEALDAAKNAWQDGSWDEGKCLISVRVAALDGAGDETGEVDWVDVECGSDPEPPACTSDTGHDWCSPVKVVGGINSNPGVWSKGGTTIVTLEVCRHCGIYRRETHYGWQRNPGQCDGVEFRDPDEASLAFLATEAE